MKKLPAIVILTAVYASSIALTGCAQAPDLRQLKEDTSEKPVNSPGQAETLKAKYKK
jgi:uncharacterized secreted protein with C-terminal beta-propeller domain